VLAQLIGFVLGIAASIIAWYLTIGVITPKVEIREALEVIRNVDQPAKYRVAVRNRRLFRDAQDVSIKVRCSYLTHTTGLTGQRIRQTFEIPIDDAWLPALHSRWHWRRKGRSPGYWRQLPVLHLEQVNEIDSKDAPRDNYGVIELIETLGPAYKGRVHVTVIAYDAWSATRKLFFRTLLAEHLNILSAPDPVAPDRESDEPGDPSTAAEPRDAQ